MGAVCCRPSSSTDSEAAAHVIVRNSGDGTTSPGEPLGRLLIFVNPNSGAGVGKRTFEKKVRPKLQAANIDYELILTTGPNHARQVVSTRSDLLSEFCGILILSGDGLIYEVLNGLFQRKDRFLVIPQLALGLIPTGSGNGLLASILASKKYPVSSAELLMSNAVEIATSAATVAQPISLFHVQTPAVNIISFLSVGWGLMADIDIESERWRRTLGSQRFTMGSIIRALNLRSYKGRLTYMPYRKSDKFASLPTFPVYGRVRVPSDLFQMVSTNEKKFNLNGWMHYWWDIRKKERIFSKRNFGGASLMIWRGVSASAPSISHFPRPK
ncbi:hypothetical protein WR25_20446 [Diploscapter pachys]|uniref:DAGKc domain-containing protein n=1 Tax=Diploscapter pachys TaxID=2018661 RepID=A0A2A2LJJ0_9BILA|nr:hypothetical protein WR25_20446 [Diploscapter pachys]